MAAVRRLRGQFVAAHRGRERPSMFVLTAAFRAGRRLSAPRAVVVTAMAVTAASTVGLTSIRLTGNPEETR